MSDAKAACRRPSPCVDPARDVARRRVTTQTYLQVCLIDAQPIASRLARAISHCSPRASLTALVLARAQLYSHLCDIDSEHFSCQHTDSQADRPMVRACLCSSARLRDCCMLLRGVGLSSCMAPAGWRCDRAARSMAALAQNMRLVIPFRMFLRAQWGPIAAMESMRSEHVHVARRVA